MTPSLRIVLLGAGGQLATALQQRLSGVIPFSRVDADLRDAPALARALDSADGDVVINTAAYNLVDQAESEPDVAYAVNALAPRALARWCGERGRVLVHVSSDYVFGRDTARTVPYREDDCPGPTGAYAVSKLAGEQFVQVHCPKHFVVRTCGLYGVATKPGKRNFVETMLKLAGEREELRVVNDQRCTPTSAADLADAIVGLIATEAYGLYHATNVGDATWYEFACEIFRQSGRTVRVVPVTSAEFPTPARRPKYSVFDCRKLEGILGCPMRPWREALGEYLCSRE